MECFFFYINTFFFFFCDGTFYINTYWHINAVSFYLLQDGAFYLSIGIKN